MIGSGQIEEQTMLDVEALPTSSIVTASADRDSHSAAAPSIPLISSSLLFLFAAAAWLLPQL